ncbi:MAG: hypothetical protein VR65_11370 [Desulfobulbaceae bacterium BRH_c16a]|nr:MAG: hypothetical protein VR65_11370 [Desulfobulbaceae bacterium BRH_c16a]
MRINSIRGICLLVILMLTGITGMAQAETKLKQLGLNPFYETELKSIDEFRQMVAETLPELKKGFEKAGAADLFDNFVAQAGRHDNVVVVEINPGEKLQWMIFKKGKTVRVVKDVVWDGKEPFTAFVLNVDKEGTRYTFVVPGKCGNVSLAMTRPVPAIVQESVPNIAPYCEIAVTPSTLASGKDLTIDASQSTDPDGSIESVVIQVTAADNSVVRKKFDTPPFIHQMTMSEPGDYTVQVSVTDDKGMESSSPKCEATKITVTSTEKTVMATAPGNFVADAGYMYQVDPAEYLLFRIGYDYYLNDSFSILGMVGAAPVIDGKDDTDSYMIDLTGIFHHQRMYYSAGVGFWHSTTDDRVDLIVNAGYRFYGEADQFNISMFVEGRGAFDQLDELNDYGRIGAGLRFQF